MLFLRKFCFLEISVRQLYEHDGQVTDIAWHLSNPFQFATISSEDHTFRMWDVRSHPAQVCIRRDQKVFSKVRYSPDCNYVACCGESIVIFDLNSSRNSIKMCCNSYVSLLSIIQ